MERVIARACVALVVAGAVGGLAFLADAARLPDIEIRTEPWRTHLGRLQGAEAPGERFRCEHDGLHRIDVAVTPLPGPVSSQPQLVLREGGPEGPIVRRVGATGLELERQGGWLRFEFEPLARSAGRELHLELIPSDLHATLPLTAWSRFRGMPDAWRPWGDELVDGPAIKADLLVEHPDLRGLAFAFRHLEGRATLTLFDADDGTLLRRSVQEPGAPVVDGWVVFGFEPLAASRYRRFTARLETGPDARVHAREGAPSTVAFFGSGEVDPRLGGLTLGARRLDDRDLIFRAWADVGPRGALARLRERLGWRTIPLIVAWLAASAVLLLALPSRRA